LPRLFPFGEKADPDRRRVDARDQTTRIPLPTDTKAVAAQTSADAANTRAVIADPNAGGTDVEVVTADTNAGAAQIMMGPFSYYPLTSETEGTIFKTGSSFHDISLLLLLTSNH
jgi:hypothetical protein